MAKSSYLACKIISSNTIERFLRNFEPILLKPRIAYPQFYGLRNQGYVYDHSLKNRVVINHLIPNNELKAGHANEKGLNVFGEILFTKPLHAQLPDSVADNISVIKKYLFIDYKQMLKKPVGALFYPFITPGSKSYANVLWDWDSWLSNIALRQILQDKGTDADKGEAVAYEQGCVLNYLAYTDTSGYMPIVVDTKSDPNKLRPAESTAATCTSR